MEDLNAKIEQLEKENAELKQKVAEVVNNATQVLASKDYSNALERLHILFKILENNKNFPTEFVSKIVSEIVETVTIPKEEAE